MSKKSNKIWKVEYGVDTSIHQSKSFLYKPLTIRCTWEEFFETIFCAGIRYDPRYDRRVLWKMIKIGKYVDRNGRLMDPNPLILADASVCYDYCTIVNENFLTDAEYFFKVLNYHESVQIPEYLQREFSNVIFPITQGCQFISMEAKNRIVSIMLVYLSDPKRYGKRELEYKVYGWDENNEPEPKYGGTREMLSILYSSMAGGEPPNNHQTRIGNLSKTGDVIHELRNSFYDTKVKYFTKGGVKKDKNIDLMSVAFTSDRITEMLDDEFLLKHLYYMTEGKYGNKKDLDDYYKKDKGNISDFKKVVTFFKKFLVENYNLRFTHKSKEWTIRDVKELYLVLTLCDLMNTQDMKVTPKNWKSIIEEFFKWYIINLKGSKKSDIIWTSTNKDGVVMEYPFKEAMTYWVGTTEVREIIVKKLVDELWIPLLDKGLVIPKSPKKRATIGQRIELWEEFPYARINGECDNKFHDPKDKTMWKKISLIEAISCNYQVDHVIPQDKGGEHELSNMEITIAKYNHWKGTKVPNYKRYEGVENEE